MIVYLVEPYYGGSHKRWAEGYKAYTHHNVTIFSMPARFWKWRMHGAAVYLADQINECPVPELFLVTDMLDVALFKSCLLPPFQQVPVCLYFHENQISYPWSPTDSDPENGRDMHYAFINFSATLVSDAVFFNSQYHLDSFFRGLNSYLRRLPDFQLNYKIQALKAKSAVLPLGMDFRQLIPTEITPHHKRPIILWNHRWEYDKNPSQFFKTLFALKSEGVAFKLIVLGESTQKIPEIFIQAKEVLAKQIIHWGYVDDMDTYGKLLWQADILPVCSIQDFFGISIVEALYCNVLPLLPNRLNYPSLIPKKYHELCIYSGDTFYTRLKQMLLGPQASDHIVADLQAAAMHYDWKKMAALYDQALLNVKNPRME